MATGRLPLSQIKEPAGASAEFKAIQLKVDAALKAAQAVLGPNAKLAGEVPHKYDDKFAVAEFVICSALGVIVNSLAALGVDCAKVVAFRAAKKSGPVTLQFTRKHTCRFVQAQQQRSRSKGSTSYYETYEWEVVTECSVLVAVSGDTAAEMHTVCKTVVDTNTDNPPHPTCATFQPFTVDVTVLFDYLSSEQSPAPTFHIDRKATGCFTAKRNVEVQKVLSVLAELKKHQEKVAEYLNRVCDTLFEMESRKVSQRLLDDVGRVDVNPVMPVLKEGSESAVPQLSPLLQQHQNSLKKHSEWISQKVASHGLMSHGALFTLAVARHIVTTCRHVEEALAYLCNLTRNQLIQAVGGVLRTRDLQRYMNNFHFQYVRVPVQYQPAPFCYVVRSEGRPQEGEIRITDTHDDTVCSFVRSFPLPRNVSCPLTPATSVKLNGTAFLHAHVAHAFGPYSETTRRKDGKQFELQLHAEARQFSCFVLLLGSVRAGNEFVTEHAVVVRDKDELSIPLQISVLPSTKDFYDRISTLASAQQDFAKAYRRMHLQGSIFGFCVVPVKDSLEKLLNLPHRCLKREVQLTQHLLTLMMDCQLPGDLLAYEESDDDDTADIGERTTTHKLEQVRQHVSVLLATLRGDRQKDKDKDEEDDVQDAKRLRKVPHNAQDNVARQMWQLQLLQQQQQQQQQQPDFGVGQQMQQQVPDFGMGQQMQQQVPDFGMGQQVQQQVPDAGLQQFQAMQQTEDAAEEEEAPGEDRNKDREEEAAGKKYDDGNLPSIVPALEAVLEEKKGSGLRGGTVKVLKTRTWSRKGYAATGLQVSSKEHVNYIKIMAEGTVQRDIVPAQQSSERNRAFDLLDALSSSGTLPLENVRLHIFFSFVQFFDSNVLDSVINDGVNPVAKLHSSSLALASLVHKVSELTLSPESVSTSVKNN